MEKNKYELLYGKLEELSEGIEKEILLIEEANQLAGNVTPEEFEFALDFYGVTGNVGKVNLENLEKEMCEAIEKGLKIYRIWGVGIILPYILLGIRENPSIDRDTLVGVLISLSFVEEKVIKKSFVHQFVQEIKESPYFKEWNGEGEYAEARKDVLKNLFVVLDRYLKLEERGLINFLRKDKEEQDFKNQLISFAESLKGKTISYIKAGYEIVDVDCEIALQKVIDKEIDNLLDHKYGVHKKTNERE